MAQDINILQIIYGCHCLDERSFHFRGKKFPICARCTGIMVGNIIGIISLFFYIPEWYYPALLLIPLSLDGGIQYLTKYRSNNPLRFITGILWGYAFVALFYLFLRHGFRLGRKIGS